MAKYDPLRRFLEAVEPTTREITLGFQRIESMIGAPLPPSAHKHRAWWANPTSPHDHPYAQAWLAAGWRVEAVDQKAGWVRFVRSAQAPI
jgi:hypothetical protein